MSTMETTSTMESDEETQKYPMIPYVPSSRPPTALGAPFALDCLDFMASRAAHLTFVELQTNDQQSVRLHLSTVQQQEQDATVAQERRRARRVLPLARFRRPIALDASSDITSINAANQTLALCRKRSSGSMSIDLERQELEVLMGAHALSERSPAKQNEPAAPAAKRQRWTVADADHAFHSLTLSSSPPSARRARPRTPHVRGGRVFGGAMRGLIRPARPPSCPPLLVSIPSDGAGDFASPGSDAAIPIFRPSASFDR